MVGFEKVAAAATYADANVEAGVSKRNAVVKWNGHAVVKAGAGRVWAHAAATLFGMGCFAAFVTLLVVGKRTGNRAMMLGAIGPALAPLALMISLSIYAKAKAKREETL